MGGAMATGTLRQTAKISALDAARGVFFIIVGLAIRSALLFLLGPPYTFRFYYRLFITFAFLFTAFRFTHGIAVVYEFEKRATETATTPSSMKVEIVFALFALEAIFLFLMAERLGKPQSFAIWTASLLVADLGYISVSKTLKDAGFFKLLWPGYWLDR